MIHCSVKNFLMDFYARNVEFQNVVLLQMLK